MVSAVVPTSSAITTAAEPTREERGGERVRQIIPRHQIHALMTDPDQVKTRVTSLLF